jgi:hypothetical protein
MVKKLYKNDTTNCQKYNIWSKKWSKIKNMVKKMVESEANEINIQMTRPSFNDGINISENYGKTTTNQRAEMKGPSDISDILSGLKTKTINIQENNEDANTNDNSTISVSDLKEMQTDGTLPKRSGRRKKSASNTVSLDI